MAVSWWQPSIGTSWTINLAGSVNLSTNAVIFDLDIGQVNAPLMPADIKAGHPERKVICYVNVGSLETDGSRQDAKLFQSSDLGSQYPGWPNEVFVDLRSENVRKIMLARFQEMKGKGCDGIDPDNMALDYQGNSGFATEITRQDQADYINWFTLAIHGLGMGVGSKNGDDLFTIYPQLIVQFDWVVVEGCLEFGCAGYIPFVQAGKPVFGIEYTDAGSDGGCNPITGTVQDACAALNNLNFDGLISDCSLSGQLFQCRTDSLAPSTPVSLPPVAAVVNPQPPYSPSVSQSPVANNSQPPYAPSDSSNSDVNDLQSLDDPSVSQSPAANDPQLPYAPSDSSPSDVNDSQSPYAPSVSLSQAVNDSQPPYAPSVSQSPSFNDSQTAFAPIVSPPPTVNAPIAPSVSSSPAADAATSLSPAISVIVPTSIATSSNVPTVDLSLPTMTQPAVTTKITASLSSIPLYSAAFVPGLPLLLPAYFFLLI